MSFYYYWGKGNHSLYMYRGPHYTEVFCLLIFILILNLLMTKARSKRHCKFLPFIFTLNISGAPARAKRAWDRAPYSWNMVNLFSFGCHVIDRAYGRTYIRTYASTDCTGGVGETIKRKGGVSQACLGKSTSLI